MTSTTPFASGREADLYDVDAHRVLRRYRHGGDTAGEVAAMAYAAGCGYPTPVVHRAHGADMILERLTGPTMLQAVTAGELHPDPAGELLADLPRRLHALPPRPGAAPADSLIHLDLHPANVMLTPNGPTVIDPTAGPRRGLPTRAARRR